MKDSDLSFVRLTKKHSWQLPLSLITDLVDKCHPKNISIFSQLGNVCIQLQNLFYTLQKFYFFINRSFNYNFIWFERTNIKFRTIRESSLSGYTRNTIFYCFCRQITDYTFTYLVTWHPRRSTLQYMYASLWNLTKNRSIWIGSNQYEIITSRSFYVFSLVDGSRYNPNNLSSFNISRST